VDANHFFNHLNDEVYRDALSSRLLELPQGGLPVKWEIEPYTIWPIPFDHPFTYGKGITFLSAKRLD
jgi:hypothetical protein